MAPSKAMDATPSIPGFQVRPLARADASSWAAYVLLDEVRQHTSSTATTLQDVEREIDKTLAAEPATPLRWGLWPADGGALVATVGFHTISPLNRTAEVAYDVAPAHWGRGIARAACRGVVQWGFDTRGWVRVQGTVLLPNIGSQRVLERCGFQREGRLRHYRIVRGQPADYWMYAVLPGELR